MGIEYEFVNVDTNLATQVFVANNLWQTPAQSCHPAPEPESQFFYTPWQFLNASQGAREYFAGGENLAIVAHTVGMADGSATPQRRSFRMPVQPGGQYLVFPENDDLRVIRIGAQESQTITVESAPSGINPFSLAIEWYQGESRIGVIEPLPPGAAALFQAGDRLLFHDTEADNPRQRYTQADLAGATAYKAPAYARQVKVTFQKRGDGKAGYTFSPPSSVS
ncbi:MAG: hypothetical protein Q8K43_08170 [Sulfurimicrobium sp.]|jgi:hypothetical protein|nr:hypothetical protein [Sulfurimicrobium sp.]MDO9189356.1 hypothetical protein [Sulfurimicrobium sp.]MDP1897846.1 hypothetical protein [Sulfurimicrobium sp.]MDP2198185.1 hypothetical protein [Sulfurimicrobium sp.]MDP2962401.1 hypothetical protein [Sulfurimicrobium sp.]